MRHQAAPSSAATLRAEDVVRFPALGDDLLEPHPPSPRSLLEIAAFE